MIQHQLSDYCIYLEKIDEKINGFFESQKPYIFCRPGCSKCCQKGAFPCSEIEFEFMNLGFSYLKPELKALIFEKAEKIKKEKQKFLGDVFNYECPFLIDDVCSVYFFRPLICRTFGLPHFDENNKLRVPFCVDDGLNYSQVFDTEKEVISTEMFEKTGFTQEPLAFNLSLKFLIRQLGEEGMGLDFGEEKTIIDWF